jgi:hypothetical protein
MEENVKKKKKKLNKKRMQHVGFPGGPPPQY